LSAPKTDDLRVRVDRGLTPLALVGHPGVGKSTRLRRLVQDLSPAVFLEVVAGAGPPVAGGEPPFVMDLRRFLFEIATRAVRRQVELGYETQPSPFLIMDLRASDPGFPQGQGRTLPPLDIARAALDELRGAAGVERVPVIVDGFDGLPAEVARHALRSLTGLSDLAALVASASPAAFWGEEAADLLDAWRIVPFGPVDPGTGEGRALLRQVVLEGVDPGTLADDVVEALIDHSGGVYRDLLQLRADAVAWSGGIVDLPAVHAAVHDHRERARRRLRSGDLAAILAADGTDGLEVPADRKARLMHEGLLLEYGSGPDARVRAHPLLSPWTSARN
jgi:hypothetical protein